MKNLALDEIQITASAEPISASSREILNYIAREGRKHQVNLPVGAGSPTRTINCVKDSHITPMTLRSR